MGRCRALCLSSVLLSGFLPFLALTQPGVGDDAFSRTPAEQDDPAAATNLEPQQQTSPQERLEEAIDVLEEMNSERSLRELVEQSYGVFIVPDYGEAAFVIGTGGGDGVLLPREDGQWRNPAFYQVGSLSAGLQAGVVAGSFALVLVSERAASEFNEEHNFSLSLEAGFVVVDRSAWARGDIDQDLDVLLWSDTEGLLGELSIGMNSIIWQEDMNQDYYGYPVTPEDVLSGDAVNPYHDDLQQALLDLE